MAVAAWLLSAYQLSEGQALTLESTGKTLPMLIGNVTAIGVGAGITVAYGRWRPDNYDWCVRARVMKSRLGGCNRSRTQPFFFPSRPLFSIRMTTRGSTMAIRGVEEEAGLEMTEAEKAANEVGCGGLPSFGTRGRGRKKEDGQTNPC